MLVSEIKTPMDWLENDRFEIRVVDQNIAASRGRDVDRPAGAGYK